MNRDKTGNRPLLPEHNRGLARFDERIQLVRVVAAVFDCESFGQTEVLLYQCSSNKGESGYHWEKIYTGLGALTVATAHRLGEPVCAVRCYAKSNSGKTIKSLSLRCLLLRFTEARQMR